MPRIISVHSFRGGTGKSNTTANISALLAMRGLRVGVVDTDIQSPGIHILFKLPEERVKRVLNDYLWGECEIGEAAYDVSAALGKPIGKGCIYLIPSSVDAADIARIIHDGYDVTLLSEGFRKLIAALNLDILVIDTHPGLNEETLLSIAISNSLVIVLRPDRQDYQGTGITVEVARELDVPDMVLLVNKAPPAFDPEEIGKRVSETYGCPVAGVLPHADEMMTLASEELFVVRFPDHPITKKLELVAERLAR